LIRSWDPDTQADYARAVDAAAERYGAELYRVVPLHGIAPANTTVGALMDVAQRQEMVEILTRGLRPAHGEDAARLAEEAVERLANHEITVVRGTDQLRAFGYRLNFEDVTGATVTGDLHHLIPLYLGGTHVPGRAGSLGNMLDLEQVAHDELHRLIERIYVNVDQGITLDPNQIGRLGLNFQEGVGILLRNGEIRLELVREAAGRLTSEFAVCE
jgi:hypothetical protein